MAKADLAAKAGVAKVGVAKVYDGLDKVMASRGHEGYLCMWCGASVNNVDGFILGFTDGQGTALCVKCVREAYNKLPSDLRGPTF